MLVILCSHLLLLLKLFISNAFSLFFPQDVIYHFMALLFYFGAFVLEAATTAANGGAHVKPLANSTETVMCITYPRGNIFTVLDGNQYSINVAATVSAIYYTI